MLSEKDTRAVLEALPCDPEEARGLLERAREILEVLDAPEVWLDAKAAADHLGVSRQVFREMAAAGEIPRHPFTGRTFRYSRRELDEWMLSRLEACR